MDEFCTAGERERGGGRNRQTDRQTQTQVRRRRKEEEDDGNGQRRKKCNLPRQNFENRLLCISFYGVHCITVKLERGSAKQVLLHREKLVSHTHKHS